MRQATAPKFAPIVIIKSINPESITFDIRPSDAPESDGGMPIEAYKLQWRFTNTEWSNTNEKEIPLVLTSSSVDSINIEINSLLSETEYIFRAASVNKPGVGVWSAKEVSVKTTPIRHPSPLKIISKDECQYSTQCSIEWAFLASKNNAAIKEYSLKWKRVFFYDANTQQLNADNFDSWTATEKLKPSVSKYEITALLPNSVYEVELETVNELGEISVESFNIRTFTNRSSDNFLIFF